MWIIELFRNTQSVAYPVLVLALVACCGLALGSIRVMGISLGVPGVLFAGLFFRHLGLGLEDHVLAFIRDFGLILFVYAVGAQVGPGFLASLRRRGLPLNLLAAAICILGALLTLALAGLMRMDLSAAAGLFAGASTNAPALASATDALAARGSQAAGLGSAGSGGSGGSAGPAFAIAYPFGLVGVILAMALLRRLFRIDPQAEAQHLEEQARSRRPRVETMNIELRNANLDGLPLGELPSMRELGVVVSRVFQEGSIALATEKTRVRVGDVLLAVGAPAALEDFRLIVGTESKLDLRRLPSAIATRQILVTHPAALGRSLDELELRQRLGVTITRVSRTEIEFTPAGNFHLQFGDRVRAVGEPAALDEAARLLGNSVRHLNLPRLTPIFLGIILGVLLGMWPIYFPGMPSPVRLGLAAGPMIVAIILARVGRVGPLIWYMPHNASQMLKEIGIVLFLAAVGLRAGDRFVPTLGSGWGLAWLGMGAVVTIAPLLVVGAVGMRLMRISFLHVCGLLAGSMTSPSLSYTSTMTASEEPAVAFATVYPLTMILRVLLAQLMVLLFA